MNDRQVGLAVLAFSTCLFLWYTVWVFVTPFVDAAHILNAIFPARKYAMILPTLAGCLIACGALGFIGLTLLMSSSRKKKA